MLRSAKKHLQRLFSKTAPPDEKTEAQINEAIKNRAPRIKITAPLRQIHFETLKPHAGLRVQIANLSATGVGVRREGIPWWPQIGTVVEGTFFVNHEEIPAKLELIHLTGQTAGLRFVEPSPELLGMSKKYFNLEMAALEMTKVNPSVLRKQSEGNPHWLYGPNNCELFAVEKDNSLVRFHLSWYGNYAEGSASEKTRFGYVAEDRRNDEEVSGVFYKGSTLIHWLKAPTTDTVEEARRFLSHIQDLPEEIRKQIEVKLTE